MNKQELKQIRKEVDEALEKVGKKFDLHMQLGNIRYTERGFNSKVKATKVDGDVTDPEAILKAEFLKNVSKKSIPGVTKNDFGKEINYGTNKYRLVGIRPRAHKYPLIGQKVGTDKKYKLPAKAIS